MKRWGKRLLTEHNKDGPCLMEKGLISVYDLNDLVTPAVQGPAEKEPITVQVN